MAEQSTMTEADTKDVDKDKGEDSNDPPPQSAAESHSPNENINTMNSESEVDDEENDPYTDVSSMSEDERGAGEQRSTFLMRANSGSSLGNGSFLRTNSGEGSFLRLNSGDGGGSNSMLSPLDMALVSSSGSNEEDKPTAGSGAGLFQFSRSMSSGSAGNNKSAGNGSGNHGGGMGGIGEASGGGNGTPVLECVADPNAKAPSSPLGSVSVQSGVSPTAPKQQLNMPRFYDSEEEGAGSLVFVPSDGGSHLSATPRVSPKMAASQGLFVGSANSSEDGGGSFVAKPASSREAPPRTLGPPGAGDADPQLLPYPHRKKLSQKDLQQPGLAGVNVPPPAVVGPIPVAGDGGRRPPLRFPPKQAPLPARGTAPTLFGAAAATAGPADPPAPLASRYKVAQIPPFKGGGGGGQNHERKHSHSESDSNNEADGKFKRMRKVKSASERPRKGRNNGNPKRSPTASPQKAAGERESYTNRPPLHSRDSSQQEVIDPTQGSDYDHPTPPASPRGSGYHIRINSQGSISSLGSNAGIDSDGHAGAGIGAAHRSAMGPQQVPPHPNAGYYHYEQQQQQFPQQYQQYAPQRGPQPQRRGPPAVAVNYNDVLGQEIAHFIHGERIASGQGGVPYQPPPGHYGPHPHAHPHPHQWNPQQHGGYGPHNPYGHYPPSYQGGGGYAPEPQAPPLTHHPNMQWERKRERLHSVSEDEWNETLEQLNNTNRARNEQERFDGRGQREPQQYPHGPSQRQYGQDPRGASNPYRQGGPRHERKHSHSRRPSDHRRTNSRSGPMEDGAPNEKSALLSPPGIRTYESRGEHHPRQYPPQQMDSGGGWGGGSGGRDPLGRHYQAPGSGRSKKSKSRRRREKQRRSMYASTTSSEEEETSRSTRQGGRSRRSKGRRHRKRRSQTTLQDDSLSETYSESLMSTSLAERSRTRESKGTVVQRLLISLKLLVCNLPLSFAAISFSIALLGVVWLKWAKEVLPSCKEVNFHSSQCAFPEFPGCYFCDEYNRWFIVATRFNTACSYLAGTSVMLYFLKATLCWRAFLDEMSSPTTASPAGLIFMTMALSFAGRGDAGELLVFVASGFHLALAVWFVYMSLAYQTMPDPSWFPNTIGIGLCAVKIWFYYPLSGHFLIAITLMLTFLYYPISLIRVALNEKMSATICWMNMMGPAVSLYALAIIMEPTFQQERPDISHFQTVQRSIYLPSMSCLFGLCLIGMVSSVHGLVVRWKQIAREEFSPAHAAYSFPLLMHALAVQSYRSSLDFFAVADEVNPALKTALRIYWVTLVVAGTITAVVCIAMYLAFLPSWVDVDTRNEDEPPPPNETSICDSVTYGESLLQPYVSPTILQANETGLLILAYDDDNGWCDLVRTRRIPAFGFEPMMGRRLRRERKALKLFIGSPDVIQEADEEEGDVIGFENEMEGTAIAAPI